MGGAGGAGSVVVSTGSGVAGGVVPDSAGLGVVGLVVGLVDVGAGDGLRDGSGDSDDDRGVTEPASTVRPPGAPRRGKTSRMGRAAGVVVTGTGVGLGRARTTSFSSPLSASPGRGRGRTALELTGPPARLTLMSPP